MTRVEKMVDLVAKENKEEEIEMKKVIRTYLQTLRNTKQNQWYKTAVVIELIVECLIDSLQNDVEVANITHKALAEYQKLSSLEKKKFAEQ